MCLDGSRYVSDSQLLFNLVTCCVRSREPAAFPTVFYG